MTRTSSCSTISSATAVAIAAAPATAMAHPGHGTTEISTLLHYLAEPLHLLGALAVLATGGALLVWRRRARDRSR